MKQKHIQTQPPPLKKYGNPGKVCFLMLLLILIGKGLYASSPVLIPNDILTFSGGEKDPVEDIYIINMGDYVHGNTYDVKVHRPQGALANYAVSVEYNVENGSLANWYSRTSGTLTFQPGETEKIITIKTTDEWGSEYTPTAKGFETAYLFFYYANRTKTEYPLIQLNFNTNGTPVASTTTKLEESPRANLKGEIGGYMLLTQAYSNPDNYAEGDLFMEVAADTKFKISEKLNTADDRRPITLSAREIGSVTQKTTFLYKFKEDAIIPDYYGPGSSAIYLYRDQLCGIKPFGREASECLTPTWRHDTEQQNVNHPDFYLPPRFGTIVTDKSYYKGGETVNMTIPFLNADVFKGALGLNTGNILNNIKVSLDGGLTYITSEQMSYDPTTKEIKVSLKAPSIEGNSQVIYAEVIYDKLNPYYDENYPEYNINRTIFIYGAFCSFSVMPETAETVYTEKIEIKGSKIAYLREDPIILPPKPIKPTLSYQVYPENCSFMSGTWSSSNPEIATVDHRGEVTPLKEGKTTITFTSSEVAFREQAGMPKNDEALIKVFDVYVEDLPAKLTIYGTPEPLHERDYSLNFYHSLSDNWTIEGDASIRFVHLDSLKYADQSFSFPIDVESDSYKKEKRISYTVPFSDDLFPKRPSLEDENRKTIPSAKAYMKFMARHKAGDLVEMSMIYDIYVAQPWVGTKLAPDQNLSVPYVEGEPFNVDFDLSQVAKDNSFWVEYIIEKNGTKVEGEQYFYKEHAPSWITVEKDDDVFNKAKVRITYQPSEPQGEGCTSDYYTVKLRAQNNLGLITNSFYTSCRVAVVPTTSECIIGPRNIHSRGSAPIDENWRPDKDFTRIIATMENGLYDSEKIYKFLSDTICDRFKSDRYWLNYPQEWGKMKIEVTNEKNETVGEYLVEGGGHSIYFPTDGEEYTVSYSWPKTKKDNLKKQFKYRYEDIRGKIYTYKLKGNLSLDGIIDIVYTTKKGNQVSKKVKVENYNYRSSSLCLYEPDGIEGLMFVTGTETQLSMDVKGGAFNHPLTLIDNPIIIDHRSNSSNINFAWTLRPVFLEDAGYQVIKLVNEKGETITKDVKINYLYADPSTMNIANNKPKGSVTTPSLGQFIVQAQNDIYYKLLFEITAKGYQPQTAEYQIKYKTLPKPIQLKTAKESNYFDVTLNEDGMSKPEDLTYLPANGIRLYSENKNPTLKLTVAFDKQYATQATSRFQLSGRNAKRTLTPSTAKVLNYDIFDYAYANLEYSLQTFIAPEKSTQTTLSSTNHKVSLNLPTLKNYALDAARQKKEAENALVRVATPPFEINKIGSKGANLRNTSGAFKKFDITAPSGLPFTVRLERDDDEWIMEAVYSKNFIPGGDLMDAIGSLQDFESVFNECRDQVYKLGKKPLTSRYDKYDNYFGKSPFIGIKAFASAKVAQNPETETYELSFNEAGLSLEVSGEVSSKTNCFIADFGVGLGGSLRSTMRIANPSYEDKKKAINEAKINFIVDTEASLEAWAYMGVGFDIFLFGAKAGIRGSAWADYHSRMVVKPYMPKYYDFEAGHKMGLGVNLQMYAWAKFLGIKIWEKNYNILNIDKTYYWPDNSSNPLKENRTIRSITRSGLLSDTYSKPLYSSKNALLTNLDISAEPVYLNDGSLVFNNLKNVDNQDDNRIQWYSKNGQGVDLDPEAKTSAYTFHASSSNNYKVAAYEELSSAFGTPDISDIQEFMASQAEKSEVVASVYNAIKGEWQSTRLTNDNLADMRPQTAVAPNGNAVVIWSKGDVRFRDNLPVVEDDTDFTDGEDTPSTRIIPESTNLKYYTVGNLMLSRYSNNAWSQSLPVVELDSVSEFNDYVAVTSNDKRVLIAATRKPSDNSESRDGDIVLISVDADDKVQITETGKKGANPQIKEINGNYLLSFMAYRSETNQTSKEEIPFQDLYLLSVDPHGTATGNINGFANIDRGVIEYKIAAKESSKSLSDLTLTWKGSLVKYSGDETTVQTGLFAAKFGESSNGEIYISTPKLILQEPSGHEISSFDIYTSPDKMKAAILISDEISSGAIITEEEFSFDNKISYLSEYYSLSRVNAEEELPIELSIKNDGYLPLKWIDVKMGDKIRRTLAESILPGMSTSAVGLFDVPKDTSEPTASYEVLATFDDGSTSTLTGSIKLSAVDMKVALMSTETTKDTTTIMLNVQNKSTLPLDKQYEVTVGLYEDILGETIFEGTSTKTIALEDLYANAENRSAVVTFVIENVKDVKPAYALVNIKKKSMLRSGGADVDIDNKNLNGKNAMIMLFPYHRTYWQGKNSSDWNDVDNWSSGLPDATLDVVIMSGTPYSPAITTPAVCRHIYFRADSKMYGQDKLTYEKAFVQYDFADTDSRGRWHMLTIPLKEAYPGDFYYGGYPEASLRKFDVATENNKVVVKTDQELEPTTSLTPGVGLIYKLDENDGTDNRGLQLSKGKLVIPFFLEEAEVEADVHFQHSFTSQPLGNVLGQSTFYKHRATGGSPAYELVANDSYIVTRTTSAYRLADNVLDVPLDFASGKPFTSVGNPFMGAISFDALQKDNSGKIKNSYQFITGKGDLETFKGYNVIAGAFGSADGDDLTDMIVPMQGFVVEKSNSFVNGSPLRFDINHTLQTSGRGQSSDNANRLKIVVDNGEATNSTVIAYHLDGSTAFGEKDSRKLVMGVNSIPEVYTLKPIGENMIAVGANVINSNNIELPLGLSTSHTDDLSFNFTGMDKYDAKIFFGDRLSQKEIELTDETSYTYQVEQPSQASVDDRFYILIKSKVITDLPEAEIENVSVYGTQGIIRAISGASDPIRRILVYEPQGKLIYSEDMNTSLYTSSTKFKEGVYIVKLITEKGMYTKKIMVANHF